MSVNRWLNWTPGDDSIVHDSPENEHTKPPKPGSVGFDGAASDDSPKIQAQSNCPRARPNRVGMPTVDLESLWASMQRIEANHISIAVLDDGTIRVVTTDVDAVQATKSGCTVYTTADLWYYVHLEPHERRILHGFKKRFGGAIEWKEPEET